MKERIKAVQRVFFALLFVSLVVIAIGVPLGGDGENLDVLDELTAFDHGFNRKTLEQTLLARAQGQALIPLSSIASAANGEGVPKVHAQKGATAVAPRAQLKLDTLSQIDALTAPAATIPLGVPAADALGAALGWRLAEHTDAERFELDRVVLSQRGCSAEDLKREHQVEAARSDVIKAQRELDVATKAHEGAEHLYEMRRKWKAPWKSIVKANEKRLEALSTKEQAQKTLDKAQAQYTEQSKAAKKTGGEASAQCAIAVASLKQQPGNKNLKLELPTALEIRPAAVGSLTGANFSAVRAAGLWDELSKLSPGQAIARVRDRFSWHYRYVEIGGIRLGGMTVLQLAPLALLPFFIALVRRSRGVGATYNPFDRPSGEQLPSVGFGVSALNVMVLMVLPLCGCALCTWSLLQLKQLPVIPMLCALGCVGLGGNSYLALFELLELRENVTRSHSNPPPASSAQSR